MAARKQAKRSKPAVKRKTPRKRSPRKGEGRPTDFKPEFVDQARKLCEFGATDTEIADFFRVSDRTIYRWQIKYPEFCQALKVGKGAADDRVERALYHRATGYTFDAVKIFMPAGAKKPVHAKYREHVPPDTTSMIFWLKNRKPDEWRDRRTTTFGNNGDDEGGAPRTIIHRVEIIGGLPSGSTPEKPEGDDYPDVPPEETAK